jgi:hypothetical protein
MLNAHHITEPMHGLGAAPKVTEFAGTIQAGRVPNDMVMDMLFVYVGGHDESMVVFHKP